MTCQRKYALYLHCLHDYWFCYENYKNHLQVYLEECKYKIKKIQMSRFINTELKSDSDSDSELDSDLDSEKVGPKFDVELMAKLESGLDSD